MNDMSLITVQQEAMARFLLEIDHGQQTLYTLNISQCDGFLCTILVLLTVVSQFGGILHANVAV